MKKIYNVSTLQNGKWVFWARHATEAAARAEADELANRFDGVRIVNKESGAEIRVK